MLASRYKVVDLFSVHPPTGQKEPCVIRGVEFRASPVVSRIPQGSIQATDLIFLLAFR